MTEHERALAECIEARDYETAATHVLGLMVDEDDPARAAVWSQKATALATLALAKATDRQTAVLKSRRDIAAATAKRRGVATKKK